MRYLLAILLVCAVHYCTAQTNFVKNPSFEEYSKCPDGGNQIRYANNWSDAIDSSFNFGSEFYNSCSNTYIDKSLHIPSNAGFYQYAHLGNGMALGNFYYDKTVPYPPSPLTIDYRDYVQGRLFSNLISGKVYCISFWVNYIECSGIAHNKLGAYLDNGAINSISLSAGSEINSVIPQIYTDSIIKDTMNWIKIEGTFVAIGNERFITIGVFFNNSIISTFLTNYCFATTQYSAYLIDDVSVVAIDAKANAGPDRWVAIGNSTDIGPVEDSTARGMDCHWYYKGSLIDSGNVITVNAASSINQIDTYVVVQNVCGTITRDTMLLKTTSLGISQQGAQSSSFIVYPNPSTGIITISPQAVIPQESIHATLYDLLGRAVHQQKLSFNNKEAVLKLHLPSATYILELSNEDGTLQRERVVIK